MIKVAVVGAGYWGPNLIRNFNESPNCQLVAVCDRDASKLAHLQARYKDPIVFTTQYDDLLSNPELDAIVIVTDINSHHALAKAALEAGKHVFVEKPLATTAEQCLDLGQAAEKHGRILMVGHTFIYNPAVHKLKEIAESGELGDVYYLYAQRLNLGRIQTTLNALWSLAVHDISIALYLFNERPQFVRAWGNAFITAGVEDVTFLNLQFPSGRLVNIHTSWLDPEKKRQITLVGSKKMVVYDDVSLDRKIVIYDKGIERELHDTQHPEYQNFSEFQLLVRSGDVTIPKIAFTEPLKLETQHFLDCIRLWEKGEHPRPLTDWQAGYEVVKVLEAAQDSLNHAGIPIEIEWQEMAPHVSHA